MNSIVVTIWFLSAAVFVMAMVMMAVGFWIELRALREEKRKYCKFIDLFTNRKIVEGVLATKAQVLDNVCKEEITKQRAGDTLDASLATARTRVQEAKRRFWHVAELAHDFGYVDKKKSYKDYLPAEAGGERQAS